MKMPLAVPKKRAVWTASLSKITLTSHVSISCWEIWETLFQ